jgi:hypothetical protein
MKFRACPCGSGLDSSWEVDARGIELCRTCFKCHRVKMKQYRREVLTNPNYAAVEAIEEDER